MHGNKERSLRDQFSYLEALRRPQKARSGQGQHRTLELRVVHLVQIDRGCVSCCPFPNCGSLG